MEEKSTLRHERIQALVAQLTIHTDSTIWPHLKILGAHVLPYFLHAYPAARRCEQRLAYVFHAIFFARNEEDAVRLGLLALKDASRRVRYRACALLAYSQRRDVVPALRALLTHTDPKTVDDAQAAITAIEQQDHTLFMDRKQTGKIKWVIQS